MTDDQNYATGPVDWEATAEMWKGRAEALAAENADLKEDEHEALAERNAALLQRDALQQRLDGMTEWGVRVSVPRQGWVEMMRSRDECERWIANPPLRYTHQVGEEFSIVKRIAAGPWTTAEAVTS